MGAKVEIEEKEIGDNPPYAVFLGWQPPFQDLPPFAQYNIRGHHPRSGSTVSAATLRELKIEVPKTPEYRGRETA